jgi:23S rRNA pseudouridine1911/1915/1917 synthase
VTKYKVLAESEKYSLLKIELLTGRTHQIRVHFSYVGHPLLGDELYGGDLTEIKRHALHCSHLEFTADGDKLIKLNSDLPEDMKKIASHMNFKNDI